MNRIEDALLKYIEGELHIPLGSLERATEGYESQVYKAIWRNKDVYIRCGASDQYSVEPEIYALMKRWKIPSPELLLFKSNITPGSDLMVITKASGQELSKVDLNDKEEDSVYSDAANVLKRMHSIALRGSGHLTVEDGQLCGKLNTWGEYISSHYGHLDEMNFLCDVHSVSSEESDIISRVFNDLKTTVCNNPVFLHNDYHEGHIFTDRQKVTSIIDFDKSLAGDACYDIARALLFQTSEQRLIFSKAYGDLAFEPRTIDYMILIAAGKVAWEYSDRVESLVPKSLEKLKFAVQTKVLLPGER